MKNLKLNLHRNKEPLKPKIFELTPAEAKKNVFKTFFNRLRRK